MSQMQEYQTLCDCWIAGQFCKAGAVLSLTDAAAVHEVAQGKIALKPEAEASTAKRKKGGASA